MADETEALLSCGDVVTEWREQVPGEKAWWTQCPACGGKWRVVKEIRPRPAD